MLNERGLIMAVLSYNCRNCGSALRFNAKTQDWTCEFCGSVFVKDDLLETETKEAKESNRVVQPDANEDRAHREGFPGQPELDDQEFNTRIKSYSCPTCGAEIITDESTAATFCFYCHNPAILPQQLAGVNRPSKVIPFAYPKNVVTDRFLDWCKRKPLLPDSFKSHYQIEMLTGIYIPYWLFDCDVNGKMSATATNVRSWTVGDTRYTETKTYDVYREIKAAYQSVPADGSKKADDKLMETIEPYDFSQIRAFAMPYLAGYQAEKYDVDSDSAFIRVEERVKKYTNTLLRNTIKGYGSVSVRGSEVTFQDTKVEYALLPVWMMTYHYKGHNYFFVMNGQTGKVAGKLPLCKGKAARYFFGISAALYVIMVLGGLFT
jgi:DNA-directed RNA polymerase subunit RPC12/RpoP